MNNLVRVNGSYQVGVKPGDRFVKVDAPSMVWVVGRVMNLASAIPHFQLRQMGKGNRQVTISAVALADKSLYRKLDEAKLPSSS
jgi:hypothetical protein